MKEIKYLLNTIYADMYVHLHNLGLALKGALRTVGRISGASNTKV